MDKSSQNPEGTHHTNMMTRVKCQQPFLGTLSGTLERHAFQQAQTRQEMHPLMIFQDVETEEPIAAPPAAPPEHSPADQTSGPSSSSTAAPPAAAPSPSDVPASEPSRRVKSTGRRGPDIVPRFPQPELSQDSNKTDWSTFQIDKSLRNLRHGAEEQQKLEVRKLHLRWWHAPEPHWSAS